MKSTSTARSFAPRIATAIGAVLVLGVLAGCAPGTETADAADLPTGTVGAVDFTNGYITVGSGATVIDEYFDPMCPYCQEFALANGDTLAALVADGTATVRLHAVVFLDPLSNGTDYSSRATNALVTVGTEAPDSVLPFLHSLYDNKPEENTTGLTNEELASLADDATGGAVDVSDALADETYEAWSDANTEAVTSPGGIVDADVSQLTGVPLVLVNGHPYDGALSDAAAFTDFVAAN